MITIEQLTELFLKAGGGSARTRVFYMATMGFTRQKLKIGNVAQCILMAIALAAIAAVCVPAGTHAATVYDGLLETQGEWKIEHDNWTGGAVDIYDDLMEVWSESENQNCIDSYNYFLSNVDDDDFFQTARQSYALPAGNTNVAISFGIKTGSPLVAEFTTGAAPTSRLALEVNTAAISGDWWAVGFNPSATEEGEVDLLCTKGGSFLLLAQYIQGGGSAGSTAWNIFARNIAVNYPVGYEGKEIITEYIAPMKDTPNMQLRGVNQWKGEFSDNNFLTIDSVPFTCDNGLTPVIHGELWNDNETPPVLMDTFTANASGLFTINFPVIEEDRNYRMVSWYDCGGEPEFSDAAHYEFTITAYGTLATESIFEDCVTNTFPFINFSACLSNVFTIVNLLVFREVEFNIGSATTNCYDLQVVDDWLNLSNPTICPQMPLVVRALATPILLFVMALAATHILNRKVHGY